MIFNKASISKGLTWPCYLLSTLFALVPIAGLSQTQWCCLDTNLIIADKTTQNLRIKISGALVNDLANPAQGVCGVRLKFRHKFVGDLTVDLVSPTGQKVRLIGPIGPSGHTNFSVWNVTFVPKRIRPVPDPGFKPKWDNLQPWGIFGQFYNGTYHPSEDSLESFNNGPVNGQWVLSITDNEEFYTGQIESFCILFCDPRGINCSACSPNGGFFRNTSFSYCAGSPELKLSEAPDFQGLSADSNAYDYRYVIIQNNQIHSYRTDLDLQSLQAGNYQICGLSYQKSDSAKLPPIGADAVRFKNALIANTIDLCGEFSKNCIDVDILRVPNPVVLDTTLCKNQFIEIGSSVFDRPGSYVVNLLSKGGCDSVVILNLNYNNIQLQLFHKDTITCAKPDGAIDISNSIIPPLSTIHWFTADGNIIDKTNPLRILINKDGLYTVTVQAGHCRDTLKVPVLKIGRVPELRVNEPLITCDSTNVTLTATTNAANARFRWTLNGNLVGESNHLTVSSAGRYFVVVTDVNGCTNAAFSNVVEDKDRPVLVFEYGIITCKQGSATINLQTTRALREQIWTGPNGFRNDSFNITVRQPGIYYITATADNGCAAYDSVTVRAQIAPPTVHLRNDTIKCGKDSIVLYTLSQSFLDTVLITGPKNFISTDLNPTVKFPGRYHLRFVDTAGCVLDTFVEISLDTLRPDFRLSGSELNCSNDSVQLHVLHSGSTNGIRYRWLGPPGFTSNLESPYVKEKGLYILMATLPNGCVFRDSIRINQDNTKPEIDIVYNEIDCIKDIAQVKASSPTGVKFYWTGPDKFTATTDTFSTTVDGIYKLIVTSANGCTAEKSILLEANQKAPIQAIMADTINCLQDSATLRLISPTVIEKITWQGPGTFHSTELQPRVNTPGWYYASALGKNGCANVDSVLVVIDTMPPAYDLTYFDITCLKDKALVKANIFTPGSTVWFKLPDDNIIRRDAFTTKLPGIYEMQITAPNGCISNRSFEIADRSQPPTFSLRNDTLTCENPQFVMTTPYFGPQYSFNWSGPGFSNLREAQIRVTKGGRYVLRLQNEFGCVYTDSVDIVSTITLPDIKISNPIFNCSTIKDPYLIATIQDSVQSIKWTYPDLSESNERQILVNQAGVYYFEAVDLKNCRFRDTLIVAFDTLAPRVLRFQLDSINCLKKSVTPVFQLSDSRATTKWTFPNGDTSTVSRPVFTEAGVYHLHLKSANECASQYSFPVVVDTVYPKVNALGGELNCNNGRIRLQFLSDDSTARILWVDPNNTLLSGRNPTVDIPGLYTLKVIKHNGCESTDTARVRDNRKPPRLILSKSISLPCVGDSISLRAIFQDSVISHQWQGKGFLSFEPSPFVRDTGWYYLTAIGANFCSAKDSIYVNAERKYPTVTIAGQHLDCNNKLVTLTANTEAENKFVWNGPGTIDSTRLSIQVTQPGTYRFTAINLQLCATDTAFTVLIDTIKPKVTIRLIDSLICEKTQISVLASPVNPQSNYTYSWSSPNTALLRGENQAHLFVKNPGDLTLNIKNPVNGCTDSLSFAVLDYSYSLSQTNILVTDPSCFNSNDGRVELLSTSSGRAPYRLSLNGRDFINGTIIGNLAHGVYTLNIKDANGCKADTNFILQNPQALSLHLGADRTIKLGQKVQITPRTNADTSQLNQWTWTPDDFLDCTSCFSVNASPKTTTRYVLRITDRHGCTVEDDVLIQVNAHPEVIVPSAFSPNGDNVNDRLEIAVGQAVRRIHAFKIYDRWGNLVYQAKDILPGTRLLSWDGSMNGEPLNPGVFIYMIDLELINGVRHHMAGDVSLLR